MIKILDNFLPQQYINDIEKLFFYHKDGSVAQINWHYNDRTISLKTKLINKFHKNKNYTDTYQFTHNFCKKDKVYSPHFQTILKILEKSKINYTNIERIKANFTTNNNKIKKSNLIMPHTDTGIDTVGKFISMIYYVHNTDGDTLFFDNDKKTIIKRVTPKKGRAVIFFSDQFHSFETPVKKDKRVIINFMVKVSD